MSQDIATQIQSLLAGRAPVEHAIYHHEYLAALDRVVKLCGPAHRHPQASIRSTTLLKVIAEKLGISDSPAAAGSQPSTAGEPTGIDWAVVEGAVRRGVATYAAAHLIPANGLGGDEPEHHKKLAENWGALIAPFVTACVREDIRKASGEPNWQRLAMKLASAPLADYCRLTTAERDFIEAAVFAERERQEIAEDSKFERMSDAASGGE